MNAEQRIAELLSEPAHDDDESAEADFEANKPGAPAWDAHAEDAQRPPKARRSNRPGPLARRSGFFLHGDDGPGPRIAELLEALARRIRNQPAGAVAVAIGAGFLVGGALSFRAGRLLIAAGVRTAAREVLKQLL